MLGRKNFEGIEGYWPPVADDPPTAHVRDRAYDRWQIDVEKVVFSRTLTGVTAPNTRLAKRDVADEVAELRAGDGGDVLVLSGARTDWHLDGITTIPSGSLYQVHRRVR